MTINSKVAEIAGLYGWTSAHVKDLILVVAYAVVALVLGSITIRRQEKA